MHIFIIYKIKFITTVFPSVSWSSSSIHSIHFFLLGPSYLEVTWKPVLLEKGSSLSPLVHSTFFFLFMKKEVFFYFFHIFSAIPLLLDDGQKHFPQKFPFDLN